MIFHDNSFDFQDTYLSYPVNGIDEHIYASTFTYYRASMHLSEVSRQNTAPCPLV